MTPIAYYRRHPRRLVVALCTVVVATGIGYADVAVWWGAWGVLGAGAGLVLSVLVGLLIPRWTEPSSSEVTGTSPLSSDNDSMPEALLAASERSTVRRKRERGTHELGTIYAILDEGLVCHVGFSDNGSTFVVPSTYARVGDDLFLHGAVGNRMLKVLGSGAEACVTVTLLDGLVFSRSAFHHSMNYRSVMLFGTGCRVDDPTEKQEAVLAILDHIAPGRSRDARTPTPSELRSTLVVRLPIEEGSAKIRTGGPVEDPGDMELPVWAGELPLELLPMAPIPDDGLLEEVEVPGYVAEYPRRRSSPDRAPTSGTSSGSEPGAGG